MKRAAANLLALLLALPAAIGSPAGSALDWANGLRRAAGRGALAPDDLLSLTAQLYAEELAAAGVLSHVGPRDGSQPLDRYFRQGGTELAVGEILGAGPDFAAIAQAWQRSSPHLGVLTDPRYTSAGAGTAAHGTQQVWVVLFARVVIEELRVRPDGGELVIEGRLAIPAPAEPLLRDGATGELLRPARWLQEERRFCYRVPLPADRGHWLLGYRSTEEDSAITNSITWPPAAGSPGGAGRSAAPAAPP